MASAWSMHQRQELLPSSLPSGLVQSLDQTTSGKDKRLISSETQRLSEHHFAAGLGLLCTCFQSSQIP